MSKVKRRKRKKAKVELDPREPGLDEETRRRRVILGG
jgi:hypothetical protein